MKFILFTLLVITAAPVMATTVYEGEPTKVLVITKDNGEVIVRDPSALDYTYADTAAKQDDSPKSLKDIIFGRKKCHKKH